MQGHKEAGGRGRKVEARGPGKRRAKPVWLSAEWSAAESQSTEPKAGENGRSKRNGSPPELMLSQIIDRFPIAFKMGTVCKPGKIERAQDGKLTICCGLRPMTTRGEKNDIQT